MARPIWTAANNNLGYLTENEFFQFQLTATNAVNYRVLSGTVPPGMQVSTTGSFQGIPRISPTTTEERVFNYRFVVRATGSDGLVSDRSFDVSVNNIRVPQIVAPATELGVFQEGDLVDIQIQGIDNSDQSQLTYKIVSGQLPNSSSNNSYKITLLPSGRLYGYILALLVDSEIYNFIVEVSDGINFSRKSYSLTAVRNIAGRRPILLTDTSEITTTKHDNFYNFQFRGYDFDGDSIQFNIVNRLSDNVLTGERGFDSAGFDDFGFDETISSIASSLTLDPDTGWLYGQLPTVNRFVDYEFDVEIRKAVSPFTVSLSKRFTLRVNQFDVFDISWITDEDLGEIYNGEISSLSVQAISPTDSELYYRILPYDPFDPKPVRLPQGLVLTDQGLLIGRPSFRCFTLDGGDTTVSDQGATTFDETFRFTVEARNSTIDSQVTERSDKTFVIRVLHRNPVPYENIYFQALLDTQRRARYRNLMTSTDWVSDDVVYRASDPNFGRQINLKMLFLPGVEIPAVEQYVNAVRLNHYRKRLKLGDLKVAVALDDDFNKLYEVVYVEVIDDQENVSDQSSIALEIDLLGTLTNYYKIDDVNQTKIYPNSFKNMKKRLLDFLTLERRGVLPRWMTSVQSDGSVLGLINAIPLVYVKPGTGAVIQQQLENKIINEIDIFSEFNFDVDRYQVDQHLSRYWDLANNRFFSSKEATFDRFTGNFRELSITDVVDYAVEVPFDSLNGIHVFQLLGYSDLVVESEQTFSVSSPSWSSWMNENAVWRNAGTSYFYGETFLIERDFFVTVADNYTIYLMNSDRTTIKVDGQTVFNNVSANITSDPNNVSAGIYLSRGPHNITVSMTVESNVNTAIQIWNSQPRGVAVQIDNGVTTVFNTVTNYEPKVRFDTRALLPGIDGDIDIQTGRRLVFVRQSDFPNYQGENHGWNKIIEFYGVLYDSLNYNETEVIPGLADVTNQRSGIWTVVLTQDNLVVLEFDREVDPFQAVIVTRGNKFGDTTLYLTEEPYPGESELRYELVPKILSNSTIFDGGDTRFLDLRDLYRDSGRGDKYIIYPNLGVFE